MLVKHTTDVSDESLVLACRQGDGAAWETLIQRYQRLIYTIPYRAGHDVDQCAEVFQQVFVTLLEKLDQIEQPSRISAWLVTTARRESWKINRRKHATNVSLDQAVEDDPKLWNVPDNDPLPEEVLIDLEEQHVVRTAVEALDDRCRTLLTLLYYNDDPPPYTEIAAQLGTSAGSIGPYRARCLCKLRRQIEALATAG
jgi:RNA polymerase sigma factor (sigma-70 family)